MAQYQSFPDMPGDSRTLEKLKALRLPHLDGKRFLDVGCNEGFFCGYAAFDGAAKAVGVDSSAAFIQRARARFPDCEFLNQSWATLPEGPFDVVLLASAIHYAEDQEALIQALMARLAPDGTLVLELGIAPGEEAEWVHVTRGIDQRFFPTEPKLKGILAPYAFKHMGRSVKQAGDELDRHVYHVRHRQPFAYLLLEPPASGKSTIARLLFEPAGIRVISGDATVRRIAAGETTVSAELASLVASDFSATTIDQTLARVVEAGHGDELIRVLVAQAEGCEFALDAYLPDALHESVERVLREEGFVPVRLSWQPGGSRPITKMKGEARADAYFSHLVDGHAQIRPADGKRYARGNVDRLARIDDLIVRVYGWAFDTHGRLPARLEVTALGETRVYTSFQSKARPDVMSHFDLDDSNVGFELDLEFERDVALGEIGRSLHVHGISCDGIRGPKFRISTRVSEED